MEPNPLHIMKGTIIDVEFFALVMIETQMIDVEFLALTIETQMIDVEFLAYYFACLL